MKANELRIGNWLQRLDGSFFQLSLYDFQVINELIERWHPSPINITEEWLLKFGFKKREDGDFDLFDFSEVDIVITNPNNSNVWKCDGVCFSVGCLEYVHQLQNLYFALTGEELIIKQ
jgi:hypothetical protein